MTVATTHSFCHQVLRGLGVAGDVDADAGFVEDLEGLVEEVVDDIYAREYASAPAAVRPSRARVGRTAVRQAFAELTPHALEPVTPASVAWRSRSTCAPRSTGASAAPAC